MNNFKTGNGIKLLKDQIDDEIVAVFNNYIAENNICFTSLEDWKCKGDTIEFFGKNETIESAPKDISIPIPLEVFEGTILVPRKQSASK